MAPDHVSKGTIDTLKSLVEEAENGALIGVAFVGVMRGRHPVYGWSGYAKQDPLFTLGALQRFNEDLIQVAKEKGY